ncbi:hypothetical protein YC2023_036235 [Brassica napus]
MRRWFGSHDPQDLNLKDFRQGRGGQAEQRGRGRGQAQLGHGRQVGGRQAEPVEPQTKIPSFGDGSSIQRDWTTSGLIGDPINQREDTCGSVVFTHLLQASYNKDKPIAQHRDLSYLVLANHIQSQTQAKGFSFRNLNIPINYIRNIGLRGVRAAATEILSDQSFRKRFKDLILKTGGNGLLGR